MILNQFWSAHVTASYNQTELTDAKNVPCTTDAPLPPGNFTFNTCDLTGERAGRLPEWSGIVTSEYFQPLELGAGNLQWYLRGRLKAETEFYSNALDEDLDSYATLDLFTGIRTDNGQWDASLWVKNVFDEEARFEALPLPPLPDFDTGGDVPNPYTQIRTQQPPRAVGITGSYRF